MLGGRYMITCKCPTHLSLYIMFGKQQPHMNQFHACLLNGNLGNKKGVQLVLQGLMDMQDAPPISHHFLSSVLAPLHSKHKRKSREIKEKGIWTKRKN